MEGVSLYGCERDREIVGWGAYKRERVEMGKELGPQGGTNLRGCGESVRN